MVWVKRFVFEDLTQEQQQTLMQRGVFFNRSLQQWYEYEENGKKQKGGTIDFLFEHANGIAKAICVKSTMRTAILCGGKL